MLEFSAAQPRIRATVRDRLTRRGLGRDRVLAAAIRPEAAVLRLLRGAPDADSA